MSAPEARGATGVIHDIGYQRYAGPRLGRRYATRSLFWHGVRAAYGIGRGAWAKVLPMGLLALACLAALILVVVSSQLPAPVLDYVGIASTFSYAATVFVAIVAPELVSADLRNNLLSLYLSRPLARSDYALAKLAALTTAVFVLFAGPMLVMFVGLAFSSPSFGGVLEQVGELLAGLAAAAIHAAVLAALALPLAALSGRRVFATGIIIAVFLLTAPVSGALRSLDPGAAGQLAGLLDPVSLLNGVDRWIFNGGILEVGPYGPVYGLTALALTALGTACAVWRYRKVTP
jgi:ABC-2 type transport system permease protein